MRNAIVNLPETRTDAQQRQVLRAAIRQIDRAEDYVGAVTNMDIADADVWRSVRRVRADLEHLRRRLTQLRSAPPQ